MQTSENASIYYPIVISVLSVAIGIVGTLMKVLWSQHNQKEQAQDASIKDLRKELDKLPFVYVMREDFVRAVTGLDMKMDTVSKDLKDLRTEVVEVIKALGGEATHGKQPGV